MLTNQFFDQLQGRLNKYDLLCHPFYRAWAAGELTRDDLRQYAGDYFLHVQEFPSYLAEFASRLPEGQLQDSVLANMQDELGGNSDAGPQFRAHSELWVDFLEGMGGKRPVQGDHAATPIEMRDLVESFHRIATEGSPAEVLAALYAYESQVPRIAQEKERGLRNLYGADEKTCAYFSLHKSADVFHSKVWRDELATAVEHDPSEVTAALEAAEGTARALWRALDGIEAKRHRRQAA
ncbi:MAG: iron-containing redox enzyme family protein [Terriglobales bacterium]|jgi:pyrroloquinoline-quinone synthase